MNISRLSLVRLLAYAGPAMPLAMLTGPVFAALPSYFTRDLGLDQAAVGIALLVSRGWDAICDPLVGFYADRIRSNFGRRRPLLVAGVPFMLFGGWILFTQGHRLTAITMGLASMIMYTGWTLTKLSHDAWGAELSDDYVERTRITATRETLALFGGLVAIVLLGWAVTPHGPGLGKGFTRLFEIVSALLLVSVTLSVYFTKDQVRAVATPMAFKQQLKTLAANRGLKKLAAAYVLNGLASALPATLFFPFVEHALGRPDLKGPFILLYFICAVAAVPLWVHLGNKLGKHQAWRLSMLVATLAFVPAVFLRTGDAIWFGAIIVITGIGLAGDMVLPPSIQADVLDEDRVLSGLSRAGLLFALLGFLGKFSYALAPGIALPILALAHFNPQPGFVNSAQSLTILALLYALLPVGLKLSAIWVLRDFPASPKYLVQETRQ